ncbi:MAG: endonuclease III [Anaerolineales bacterium]|nr:endonuclease III [Anaerolineales bacterium]MCB9127256.1 endonuclease III [Ardenticatenales bacterium]
MDVPTMRNALTRIRTAMDDWQTPLVDAMAASGDDPYRILIATLLSLRTRDEITALVSDALFARAATPHAILALPVEELREIIRPVGFYNNKTDSIREVSRLLLEQHEGRVPDELDELLRLPGVGRKTANLVVTAGYGKPGICVDTHVHRISNRFGFVETKNPDKTEMALREKLPPDLWMEINMLLVSLGQTICHPTSPKCSICPVNDLCERVGVTRSR